MAETFKGAVFGELTLTFRGQVLIENNFTGCHF